MPPSPLGAIIRRDWDPSRKFQPLTVLAIEFLIGTAGLEPAATCLEVGSQPFLEVEYFMRSVFNEMCAAC